jgi:hypothetical protein
LIRPAGWPAGCDWLLPGVTPIQVQAHEFNWHQPWALPEAFLPPPPAFPALPPPPLLPGLGAGGGPSPSGAAAALPSGGVAGVAALASAGSAGSAGLASGASPVLELYFFCRQGARHLRQRAVSIVFLLLLQLLLF